MDRDRIMVDNSRTMNKRIVSLVGLIAVLFAACTSNSIYEDSYSFDDTRWTKDSIVRFSVDVTDTTKSYDVAFTIVNTDEYPYANLFLFTDIVFPDKHYMRDTLEFMLSTPDGEWLGSGLRGYSNTFQYQSNIRFPHLGTYVFAFEQAMRCTSDDCGVSGIKSVSLEVTRR